jgi:hypothetical protein
MSTGTTGLLPPTGASAPAISGVVSGSFHLLAAVHGATVPQ